MISMEEIKYAIWYLGVAGYSLPSANNRVWVQGKTQIIQVVDTLQASIVYAYNSQS